MIVTINGKKENINKEQITVSELLELKKVKMPEMVSVELNDELLERNAFSNTNVSEKDRIEFLYFMGGGAKYNI